MGNLTDDSGRPRLTAESGNLAVAHDSTLRSLGY
jgi:hypothetical protein